MSNKDSGKLTDSVFTEKQIQNYSDDNFYFKELNQNQKKAYRRIFLRKYLN